jgi:hypothetical protein
MAAKELKIESKVVANVYARHLSFQLSHSDFLAFYSLFADANNRQPGGDDFYEMLVQTHVADIYKKLQTEGKEEKSVYTFRLSPAECMASWIYWTDHPFPSDTLVGKLLDQVNNIILLMFTKTGCSECYL